MELALWLKRNDFRADQVQNFYPSPMATATAMYHSGKNPLKRIKRDSENVPVAKAAGQRKLHKAFLRYHDPANWPLLRDALRSMGREDLIGSKPEQLIPAYQPADTSYKSPRRKNSTPAKDTDTVARNRNSRKKRNTGTEQSARAAGSKQSNVKQKQKNKRPQKGTILTQHSGLPPREHS